jgi:hypothetical protein
MTYRMRQSIPWRTSWSVFAQGEPRREPKQCPDRDDEGRLQAPFAFQRRVAIGSPL